MIPIYCINLPRATERKEQIKKQWIDELHFDITFFDAFDRRQIETQTNFIYTYQPKIPILKIRRPLSYGELACLTSYCLLCEQLLKDNITEVILMEDDITPLFDSKEYFYQTLSHAAIEFPDSEIVLTHNPTQDWVDKSDDNKYYIRKRYFSSLKIAPWGTQLIYFKQNGLQKFYDNLVKMQYPADHIWNDVFVQDQKIIYSNESLVYHENSINGTTYIGNEYRALHRSFVP